MIEESQREVSLNVMEIQQPIGKFYVGKMAAKDLIDISWFDVRKLTEDGLDQYLGIQRKVSENRTKEIAQYVTLSDASFPTAVILAIEADCVEFGKIESCDVPDFYSMKLRNKPGNFEDDDTVLFRGIARVLDGQHRIKGLFDSKHDLSDFEINVCIFVDADIADQASIFATVNLAQTKVNPSLVYDLLAYRKSRSPERTCHNVTVALDRAERSPFYGKIKRLGVATEGRTGETLTQSTVVRSLLPYLTDDPLLDRERGRFGSFSNVASNFQSSKLIFRQWYLDGKDEQIAEQLMNYFEAARRRWTRAWETPGPGEILPRTNGFRAFMRFLRPVFNHLYKGDIVKMSDFKRVFDDIEIDDNHFHVDNYPPGSSGEGRLYRELMASSGLDGYD